MKQQQWLGHSWSPSYAIIFKTWYNENGRPQSAWEIHNYSQFYHNSTLDFCECHYCNFMHLSSHVC